jgi:hypothetical protein
MTDFMKFCRLYQSIINMPIVVDPYLDLVPNIIITLEHAQMVLYGYNDAVALYQLLAYGAGEVSTSAHCDDWGSWRRVVFAIAEGTARKNLLCPLVICPMVSAN